MHKQDYARSLSRSRTDRTLVSTNKSKLRPDEAYKECRKGMGAGSPAPLSLFDAHLVSALK